MKTVREMFVSLTAMLINHIWASIIEICVEKWRTQSLKKLKFKCPDMRNGIDLRRLPRHVRTLLAIYESKFPPPRLTSPPPLRALRPPQWERPLCLTNVSSRVFYALQ